jgi:IclR family transcriptional regulator, mhp operon transcriptional activator
MAIPPPPMRDTSLDKGLLVLELMNRHVSVRVRDLHDWTGLPKPTLVRILNTLQRHGYVRRISREAGYSVTSGVTSLSAGFHGVPALVERAAPHLERLTARRLWPASLAMLDHDAMVVRYSTIPASPFSHRHSTLHMRLDLAGRAHGRAYLAACSDAERDYLLAGLPADQADALRALLPAIRAAGYAQRHPGVDPQTSSIAVALVAQPGRPVGTIGFTYFRRAIGPAEEHALARDLIAAADAIMADTAP